MVTRRPEFASCWTKIDRAREHRKEFDKTAKEWLDTKPYKLRTEFYTQTDEYIVWLDRVPRVPLPLFAIVGDVVHNLRSALDYLIYRAACLDSGKDPPPRWKDLAFPIVSSDTDFDTGRRPPLGKLNPDFRADIKKLQPFCTHPDDFRQSRLWVLNQLDIVDKHREFPLGLVIPTELRIDPSADIAAHGGPDPGPLEDGAQVLAYRSDDANVNVNIEPSFAVAFGKSDIFPEGAEVMQILVMLDEIVESIVASVAKH